MNKNMKTKRIRKNFKNKKDLIKYILDADSID